MLLYLSKLSPSHTITADYSHCTGADEWFITNMSGCRANVPFANVSLSQPREEVRLKQLARKLGCCKGGFKLNLLN